MAKMSSFSFFFSCLFFFYIHSEKTDCQYTRMKNKENKSTENENENGKNK